MPFLTGRLSPLVLIDPQGGTHCLGRARDNTAMLVPCSEGYEYVDFVMPEIVPTPVVSYVYFIIWR